MKATLFGFWVPEELVRAIEEEVQLGCVVGVDGEKQGVVSGVLEDGGVSGGEVSADVGARAGER